MANWYDTNIRPKCTGRGKWSECILAVKERREEIIKKAEAIAIKNGHHLSPFNAMNQAQCLKCGRWIFCNNIMAPTVAADITGRLVTDQCISHLDGSTFSERDKYPEAPRNSKALF